MMPGGNHHNYTTLQQFPITQKGAADICYPVLHNPSVYRLSFLSVIVVIACAVLAVILSVCILRIVISGIILRVLAVCSRCILRILGIVSTSCILRIILCAVVLLVFVIVVCTRHVHTSKVMWDLIPLFEHTFCAFGMFQTHLHVT